MGIIHNGVVFPVAWTMLEKEGNSNSCQRMDLLDQDLCKGTNCTNCSLKVGNNCQEDTIYNDTVSLVSLILEGRKLWT